MVDVHEDLRERIRVYEDTLWKVHFPIDDLPCSEIGENAAHIAFNDSSSGPIFKDPSGCGINWLGVDMSRRNQQIG